MHFIQRKIIGKLLYAETLPYSAMRPEGIESNHYAYHLEQLLKDGLVVKQETQYSLSARGLRFIDRISQEKITERLQPHIVTAIEITNEAGQTLLFKRNFQPYIYRYGFPLGKTHYEEDLLAAANRELQEKTGLIDVNLHYRGDVYVQASQKGEVISKILCHVFQGKTQNAVDVSPDKIHRGEAVWMDHRLLQAHQFMPGFMAIKGLLSSGQGLFFDEVKEEF